MGRLMPRIRPTLSSSALELPVLLSYTLGKDGRRVHVIERDLKEPDRIVGELLQPGDYLKLIELDLEDCVEKINAQRVYGYALFKDGKSKKLSYPLENFRSLVAGRSFHNGRFIQRMRHRAATLPNVSLEQGSVTSLLEEKGTIKGVDVPLCFVGLVLENCELPHVNSGHFILADPSPILFYPISSTEVRCLVNVPGRKVPSVSNGEMAHYLKTTVAPQPVASTINTLAGTLYKVFSVSPDTAMEEMWEACFDYEPWRLVFNWTYISTLRSKSPSRKPSATFLFCGNIRCRSSVTSVSFSSTHLDWGLTGFWCIRHYFPSDQSRRN
ncbi:Squalene monooxygenase [Hibiscus syriacus]|uniref:Squalene monooxygenase n=1 Tax=Hibiscus syriacus TaxID=106335 RepID=A0A6A2Y3F8_HIBSY|nr:Squalene monooxygenase [Hibiscus syriacus]